MKNIKLVGIDIAKTIFQIYAADKHGKEIFTKRVSRLKLIECIMQLPENTLIVMEACGSANHWARQFISLNYEVKLISPQFVKPFVKGNKNDRNDSKAIVEAALRPEMRFVPIKTLEQQDIQSLHRARQLAVRNRTAYANQIHGLLSEYGVILPQGVTHIRTKLMGILEDAENGLTYPIREIVNDIYEQFQQADKAISRYEQKVKDIACSNKDCCLLMRLPGVGPIIATAMIAAVGDGREFRRGREMAAWLGLTPKHHASGNKHRMQGISKRGDRYLRTLLVHGGRSVLLRCSNKTDKRSLWISDKIKRLGNNKAAVALANKTVREIWSVLRKKEQFVFNT